MKLRFQNHSYPGENSRPTPEIHIDETTNSVFVVVPWGSREAAKKVIDRMTEYLAFAAQDREATPPDGSFYGSKQPPYSGASGK